MLGSAELKQFETKERMMQCSLLWKEMSDEQKNAYIHEAEMLNLQYKMDYSAYVEKLSPDSRAAFLAKGGGVKRPAAKSEATGKKMKKGEAAAVVDVDSGSEVASDEDDFESPKKIQKPNSSLQMFCDSNVKNYEKKNPKLSKQELTRLMAKDFAKLGEDKKKVYDTMAQKSKTESAAKGGSSSKTMAPAVKKGVAASAKASTSNGTSSKSSSAPPSSPLKAKPSLNATAKPTSKAAATKAKAAVKPKDTAADKSSEKPIWAFHQNLYKHEPPKPPQTVQQWHASCATKKPVEDLSQEEIDNRWKKLATPKRAKLVNDHKEMMSTFSAAFEKFVRELPRAELKRFRMHVKVRDSGGNMEDDSDDSDSDEEDEDDQSDDEGSESEGGDDVHTHRPDDDQDDEDDSGNSDDETGSEEE